jgi:hypothetical protein
MNFYTKKRMLFAIVFSEDAFSRKEGDTINFRAAQH